MQIEAKEDIFSPFSDLRHPTHPFRPHGRSATRSLFDFIAAPFDCPRRFGDLSIEYRIISFGRTLQFVVIAICTSEYGNNTKH